MTFDLISDLHVDFWSDFDWAHQATSPFCVIAGDVARNRHKLRNTLEHISQQYKVTLYIDGNEEHRCHLEDLESSYRTLAVDIDGIPNFNYIQNQVVVINGTAFLGTNLWYTFDCDHNFSAELSMEGIKQHYGCSDHVPKRMRLQAINDAEYLQRSVKRLQTMSDVEKICIVSHSIPHKEFIMHDVDIGKSHKINASVNSLVSNILEQDTENKIKVWCFGHYHWPLDLTKSGVRYICNPKGRVDTPWHRPAYFPLRVVI